MHSAALIVKALSVIQFAKYYNPFLYDVILEKYINKLNYQNKYGINKLVIQSFSLVKLPV